MKLSLALLSLSVTGAFAQMDPCSDAAAATYERQESLPGFDDWRYTWSDVTATEAQCLSCVPEYAPPAGYTGRKNAKSGKCGVANSITCDYPEPGIPSTAYPNGFHSALIAMDNEPPFCLTVNDARNTNVMVLIETLVPNQRICVKTRSNGIALQNVGLVPIQCDEGQLEACFPGDSTAASLPLLIFCDQSCPEGPIPFRYKVDHSMSRTQSGADNVAQDSAVKNVDMWCAMQNGQPEKYWPSELAPLLPLGVIPHAYLNLMNGAASAAPALALATGLAAGVLAMFL